MMSMRGEESSKTKNSLNIFSFLTIRQTDVALSDPQMKGRVVEMKIVSFLCAIDSPSHFHHILLGALPCSDHVFKECFSRNGLFFSSLDNI